MAYKAKVLVTGAGGFIGHHLVGYLVDRGYWVRGVDIKQPEYEPTRAHEFELLDLARWDSCLQATRGVDEVYGLAANMGGIGFIETNKAVIVRDNTLINMHTLEAARINGIKRYLYTSSACIYPGYKQTSPDVTPLKEEDAYPADAEDGYGWEKLYMERTCRHYYEDFGDRNARGAVSQHLRTARHIRWRAREVSRRHLPKGRAGCEWRGDRGLG